MRQLLRHITLGVLLLTAILCCKVARGQYNRDYFFWVGRTCMMNNDYQEAIRTLNTLLRYDKDAFEGYFLRGIAKYNLDDLIGAEEDFTTAIRYNPVYTQAFTYRAITRSRLGNYDDALKDFREAIDLRPDLPGAYYSRGVTRLLNQQFKDAISDFNKFLLHEDKVADAWICRGLSYLHLKDTTRAYTDFNRAIKTNREDPNGYNRRGALYLDQKKYEDALWDFNKAIECDSTYILSYFNRALVYNSMHRPMKALKDFDHVIRLDSTNSLTYFNRAMLLAQIGDYNRALEDYDKVAEYSPNNVLVYYNRAGVHAQLGSLEEAVADYSSAIDLYPDFANAYIYRSRLKILLGDPKGARRDQNTAQRKIAEYRSRLSDSTYSIYADTTQHFDKLLAFDNNMAGGSFERITGHNGGREDLKLLPLFKFTLRKADSVETIEPYHLQRVEDFKTKIGNELLVLSCKETNLAADSLVKLDRMYLQAIDTGNPSWMVLFQRGISQSLIKQYTNSVNTLTQAIELNPGNPFIYLNRSTTRAEMIDFISSIDNTYQRITIDADPAKRLNNTAKRTYSYDEAVADLNKAIKLYPGMAHAYYNRANLRALSGCLPEAFDDYTKAIEMSPQFAEAYYNRGIIQIFMKDTRKGCLDLSKAGELGILEAYEILKQHTKKDN